MKVVNFILGYLLIGVALGLFAMLIMTLLHP